MKSELSCLGQKQCRCKNHTWLHLKNSPASNNKYIQETSTKIQVEITDYNSFEKYAYITRTSLGENTGKILITEALKMLAHAKEMD